MQTIDSDLDQEAVTTTVVEDKFAYNSPELRIYGDVYERTNTSLPFTFKENFVLNKTT